MIRESQFLTRLSKVSSQQAAQAVRGSAVYTFADSSNFFYCFISNSNSFIPSLKSIGWTGFGDSSLYSNVTRGRVSPFFCHISEKGMFGGQRQMSPCRPQILSFCRKRFGNAKTLGMSWGTAGYLWDS